MKCAMQTHQGEADYDAVHWVQMTPTVRIKPMTHDERRELIERPIGRIIYHGGAISGGNALASDGMQQARRRLHSTAFVLDDLDFYKD